MMEVWIDYKVRMFVYGFLIFAMFAGGTREEIDDSIKPISQEDGIQIDRISREVVATRKIKLSKQCKKFQKKCSKVCKNSKICQRNKKCKKCCRKCKVPTPQYSTPPPSYPTSILTSTIPSPVCPACPSTLAAATCSPPEVATCPPPITPPTCPPPPSTKKTSTSSAPSTTSTDEGAIESTDTKNDCYQNFTLSNGEVKNISSPGFTENQKYPNNVNCKWTFTAPVDEKVSITLLYINTELGYDVVRVMDGISEQNDKLPILATMSGDEAREAVISRTSEMTVTFTSDINVNMTGFQANVAAFKKADLPKFTWIDLFTLNIKYPNGFNETIPLSLGADVDYANDDMACIFTGQNLNTSTSVIITSPSSTKECKSLDQQIEIVLKTLNLQNYKSMFTMKNGKLEQLYEQAFENNEISNRIRNIIKIKVPKKIRIPIQFAYEKGLEAKFLKYEQDTSYIKKRIREIYHASKYSLKNILNDTNVEFILEKNIIFINEFLELNETTLLDIRKYQIREDVPLVVLCTEDYNNNVKGLSFRSGACRRDMSRFGAVMLTWRDDGGLAADVLEHELSHIIGGVHNHKNATETEVGHNDFNSENINAWFTLAGHRCYGKDCLSPTAKSNGSWICDSDLQSCYLKCDRGFTNMSSPIIECHNGNWSENINLAVCSPSVYLVAGGIGTEQDVEIFHPNIPNVTCHNKPPPLTLEWKGHTTFSDQHNLYLCGGGHNVGPQVLTARVCTSYNYITKTWTPYSLLAKRDAGHSSVVVAGSVFLVGGASKRSDTSMSGTTYYDGVVKTQLPMEDIAPNWTPVTNLKYKGKNQCVLTADSHHIVIIGGEYNYVSLSTVTSFNVVEGTTQELAPLMQGRDNHGCIILEEDGSIWIVVTGGRKYYNIIIASTERLNLSQKGSVWESSGDLNVGRDGHEMALTIHGVIVVGGGSLKSIELLNFVDKSWKVLEASLTTPRWNYGGIVELPAHFFNCELDTYMQTDCQDVPIKENGNWICDSTSTIYMLNCAPGFSSAFTTTTCERGVWKDINKIECTESVYIVVGGDGAERNVEIFHPEMEKMECSNPPPSLDLDWESHTSFTHQGTLYLCGGHICVSNKQNKWRQQIVPEDIGYRLSSVVFGNNLFLVGGSSIFGSWAEEHPVVRTVLPIIVKSQHWTTVPNLYKGEHQCALKIGIHLMAIIGGDSFWSNHQHDVIAYNVLENSKTVLAPLVQGRGRHGCILIQDNGSSSILVTGGYYIFGNTQWNREGLKSTEMLSLKNNGSTWVSSGDLKVPRYGHGMTVTAKGPIVVAGQSDVSTFLKSIEIFNLTTQTWTEYGQSLATPRSMFGGIMELPAVLFGCQTRPIKIEGCTDEYRYDQEFTGGVATPVGEDETCHSVCEKDDNCMAWTWTKEEKCRIISQQSQLKTIQDKTGSVAGLKTSCKPKCYLVLSTGEEASTNTQFCASEDTETECFDMIHMDPDDFQEGDNGKIMICHEGLTGCSDVPYRNVHAACNSQPSIVTNSIYNRLRKRRFTRSNYVTLG